MLLSDDVAARCDRAKPIEIIGERRVTAHANSYQRSTKRNSRIDL